MSFFLDWYFWYYGFLAFFGFLYVQQKNVYLASKEGQILKSEDDYRVSIIFSVLVFLPLILIAGFRDKWLTGDTGAYAVQYESLPSSIEKYLNTIDWDSKNPGFNLFAVIVKQIIGLDYRGWFVLIASISGLCLAIGYRRYASNVVLCAFLFFASTDFHSWMMNGIRQFLVAAILFALFPLVQKKRIVSFVILVLILFTIHRSAIVVLPLYLCALGKPFNKRTLTVLLLCFAAILFVGQFTNLLDDSLQKTAYKNMVSEFKDDDGTNILRVLVYSVPAIIAIIKRKQFDDSVPEIINISVNLSLITAGLYFLSVPISGIFMGRLPIYFSLFNYILLPWELKNLFGEDMNRTLTRLMIVLYLVFFTVQMITWGY